VRHADRVLAVVDEDIPAGWDGPPRFHNSDLVITSRPGTSVAGWMDRLLPRTTYRVPRGPKESVAVVARRLTGTSVGVVLSGGGARGLAHIGALEEILAAGIKIDRVAGCSFGAFIGGMYAQGMGIDEIDARCYEEWVRRRPLNDYTLPRTSIIRGQKIREMLARNFNGAVELTARNFFCVTTDVLTAELVVHRRGSLVHAVGGSMNLPGLAPPLAVNGRLLVDGGLRNNLPIDIMAESGEGPMIAVDVGGATAPELARGLDFIPPAGNDEERYYGASEEDLDVILPSLGELMTRIVTLSSADGAMLAAKHASLVIRPGNEGVGLFEFHQLDVLRGAGRRAARQALIGEEPATASEPRAGAVAAGAR
jgi:predicted acylesterase/phospholipase RssA